VQALGVAVEALEALAQAAMAEQPVAAEVDLEKQTVD